MIRFLCAALVFWGTVAVAQESAPAGDAAKGKALYVSTGCYECHGYAGQGARPTGPRLAPDLMPYEAFAGQLRKPVNNMPAYTAAVMPDQEIADVYAWLKTLPGPAKDVAILKP